MGEWSDRDLDALAQRVGRNEEGLDALGKDLREDIRDLRRIVVRRFDSVDADHAEARTKLDKATSPTVKSVGTTMLAVATGVGVPIAVAYLASGGGHP